MFDWEAPRIENSFSVVVWGYGLAFVPDFSLHRWMRGGIVANVWGVPFSIGDAKPICRQAYCDSKLPESWTTGTKRIRLWTSTE